MEEESSIELVNRLQQGEPYAFEQLFQQYSAMAVRTAYLITNNRALADDIAQEAFVQCYLKIADLKNPEQFKTWFFKTLTRIAWRMDKKEKTVVPIADIFDQVEYLDDCKVEEDFIKKESGAYIMEAVNKLELKQKTTVLLYYYNEFSVAEIAGIMGCFEGTVKSRLYTARRNLKKQLKQEPVGVKGGSNDAIIYKI